MLPVVTSGQLIAVTPFTTSTCKGGTAGDGARACVAALAHGLPQRVVHVSDDTDMKMGDYFDLVADRFALARPRRVSRREAATLLSPTQLSFLDESRRLVNTRMKRELGVVLRHSSVGDGLDGAAGDARGE